MNPHDLFDHDGVNENILLDVPWKGATRKVLLHPDRNGILYMLDRATGEVLSAEALWLRQFQQGRGSEDR